MSDDYRPGDYVELFTTIRPRIGIVYSVAPCPSIWPPSSMHYMPGNDKEIMVEIDRDLYWHPVRPFLTSGLIVRRWEDAGHFFFVTYSEDCRLHKVMRKLSPIEVIALVDKLPDFSTSGSSVALTPSNASSSRRYFDGIIIFQTPHISERGDLIWPDQQPVA